MTKLFLNYATFLLLSAFLTVPLASPASSQDKLEALDSSRKYYASVNVEDYFVGYFTPPVPDTGHNFRTCNDTTRKVNEEDVEALYFSVVCIEQPKLYKPVDFADFIDKATGEAVFAKDGSYIGTLETVAVSEKGTFEGFLIREKKTDANRMLIYSPTDLSFWSYTAESNSTISILAESLDSVSVLPIESDSFLQDPATRSKLLGILGSRSDLIDANAFLAKGGKPVFPYVDTFAPEAWLTPDSESVQDFP